MSDVALRCTNLTKNYSGVRALSDLSFELNRGHTLALLGPSGCGKTTTLRLIAGFEVPDGGTIEIDNQGIAGPGVLLPPEKRHVGMVFQDYALFPHLTVKGNVAYGLARGPQREGRIREVLSLVGLSALESRMPYQLSGGEQQRVALARALVTKPVVLLLDEPFSNLDPGLRLQVREEVKHILKVSGATAVFVTHDQDEAFFMGDEVAILNRGRLEQLGAPEKVYESPVSRFVAQFVGLADFLPTQLRDGALWTEIGPVTRASVTRPTEGLDVMVRPDDLTLRPSDKGCGKIAAYIFQGSFVLYRVTLDSGKMVHCLQPHFRRYPVGTRVEVGLDSDQSLVCFRRERAIFDPFSGSAER